MAVGARCSSSLGTYHLPGVPLLLFRRVPPYFRYFGRENSENKAEHDGTSRRAPRFWDFSGTLPEKTPEKRGAATVVKERLIIGS